MAHSVAFGANSIEDITMHLLIQYYATNNPARNEELKGCIRQNLELGLFDKVHAFTTGDVPADLRDRLCVVKTSKWLTYGYMLSYAHKHLKRQICVFANTDIIFDETILNLHGTDLTRTCLCISRHEDERVFEKGVDVFVFKPPIGALAMDVPVGYERCDYVFVKRLHDKGVRVVNPALSIRALHVHACPRTSKPRLEEEGLLPTICRIGEESSLLEIRKGQIPDVGNGKIC